MPSSSASHMPGRRSWLDGAALYQIYPLSFRDGNGDGWGDLAGVYEGLDHVAALGVDAIWLSPFYTSPLADFGYDIADHKAVDPRMGDLAAFDRVLAKAHRLGMRVLLDLVLGHTSQMHPWFAESRRSRDNDKADWFVWADPSPDGSPPNNWLSVFGGPAWSWEPRRRQYYLHHFLPQQPTLNYRSAALTDAMMDVARFWLDRGVDGFRVDAVDFLARDPGLRSNPPVDAHPYEFPAKLFGMQMHIHDMMHADVRAVLERLRRVTDDYDDRVLLGELSSQPGAAERIARYTAPGGLHSAYTLDLPKRPFTPQGFRTALMAADSYGHTCWSFSNHDVERAASRWWPAGADPARFEALLAVLMSTLPGTICLYQGDELGLGQAELEYEHLRDPFGLNYWPEFKGRDGSRTPMPWTPEAPNAGFCPQNARPWLPVDRAHLSRAVAVQERRNASALSVWRAALGLRRTHPALSTGALTHVDEDGAVLSFARDSGDSRIVCAFNFSTQPAACALPAGDLRPIQIPVAPGTPEPRMEGGLLTLPPLGVFLGEG
ncbi:alpha-glucosidase [Indioceanicola profundi]|uniref:alpha-glucosidase n=1 Tax=Indioceanicola profundi TaxID=2220096 RepID=UPI001CECF9B0|nr:alpha-glucosidase [Indioceanicola profundi]